MLDGIDRQLVGILQRDGRASHAEVARRLGTSEATARRRLERLLADGRVRVVAVVNPLQLGMIDAIVGVHAQPDRVAQVAEALAALPEVRYVGITTGVYDLILECLFRSREEELIFFTEKIAAIPGIVRTQTSTVLLTKKATYDWEADESAGPRATGDDHLDNEHRTDQREVS